LKEIQFGVATIVYSRKLQKNKKDKTISAKKPHFGSGSRLHVGKVLVPHSVRPIMIPLVKGAKGCSFFKMFIFSKDNKKIMYKRNKNICLVVWS